MSKMVVLVVVAFLGFWMFTDPSGLAGTAQSTGGWAWSTSGQFFGALREFVRAL